MQQTSPVRLSTTSLCMALLDRTNLNTKRQRKRSRQPRNTVYVVMYTKARPYSLQSYPLEHSSPYLFTFLYEFPSKNMTGIETGIQKTCKKVRNLLIFSPCCTNQPPASIYLSELAIQLQKLLILVTVSTKNVHDKKPIRVSITSNKMKANEPWQFSPK